MENHELKRCPRCGKCLPISSFGVRSNGKPQHWCRTCHRVYQREYYSRKKDYYLELQNQRVERNQRRIREAKNVPCADCGRRFPHYIMDFDHRPGEKKCFNLAIAAGRPRLSWEKIAAEIAKCDVVCANCHRERTYQRRKKARQDKELFDLSEGTPRCCSSVVERFIGNEEVVGPTPTSSSLQRTEPTCSGTPTPEVTQ